jgi:DNA (cytosine-5)-methyltransferase 1
MSGELTVISTFAGCGGSSLGYKWAGFRELLAIDFEPHAVETFKLNFPGVDVWQADIRKVTAATILKRIGIKKGELDVLDGSPPCQGFSTAGKRKVTDVRNDLPWEFIRLIEGLQPRAFVMENVSGMAKGGMRGVFNEILAGLKETSYHVEVRKLNAMWYGVPQSRERIIFVGMRDGQDVKWPVKQEIITVKDAIGDLGNVQDPSIDHAWIDESPEGRDTKGWHDASKVRQGGEYGAGQQKVIRYRWDRPARTMVKFGGALTVYLGNAGCHPLYTRTFSLLEFKRLNSFPDVFKFIEMKRSPYNCLGNAVPPKMMQAIAECVKEVLTP